MPAADGRLAIPLSLGLEARMAPVLLLVSVLAAPASPLRKLPLDLVLSLDRRQAARGRLGPVLSARTLVDREQRAVGLRALLGSRLGGSEEDGEKAPGTELRSALIVLLAALASCAERPQPGGLESATLGGNTQDIDFCGPARQGSTFTLRHGGHTYRLPRNVQIDRDNRTIHRDAESKAWQPPWDDVIFFGLGRSLLIEVTWSDCVDLYSSRLFVIGPEGQVAERAGLTSYWRDGFLRMGAEVVYWNEWFCYPQNKSRRNGKSFVLAFSEQDRLFEQRDVDDGVYCDRREQLSLLPWIAAKEKRRANPNRTP